VRTDFNGWKSVALSDLVKDPRNDIVDGPFGSRLKASEYVDAGVPIVRLQNINRNKFVDKNIKFVTRKKASEIARHHFMAGDVLISKLGDPLGEACIAPDSIPYGILVADVVRVRPNKSKVDTAFLSYALNSAPVVAQFEAETKGTTRPRVNLKKIRDLKIPYIDSLDEQREIVAEIEKQFTRLEAGVAGLRRAQANLKRYRAAVLKAACEGKLTEKWRQAHPDVEPASEILKRIIAHPADNQRRNTKFIEAELGSAVDLPDNWLRVSVELVSEIVDGDRGRDYPKQNDFLLEGYCLFLSAKNVRPYGFVFIDNQFISREKHEKLRKGTLKPGDIVFTSRGTIGNIAHYTGEIEYKCVRINSGMFILRGFQNVLDEKYFAWYLRSSATRNQIAQFKSGTAQPQLPIREFKTFTVNIPPKIEQGEIVREIERRISIIDGLESNVSSSWKRVERLRQALLQEAFTGRLTNRQVSSQSLKAV
jgi:type I restriction enzyme S subunit